MVLVDIKYCSSKDLFKKKIVRNEVHATSYILYFSRFFYFEIL